MSEKSIWQLRRVVKSITPFTHHGGLITAFNIFRGEDPTNWGAHIKVAEITGDDLLAAITPYVIEILDIRET